MNEPNDAPSCLVCHGTATSRHLAQNGYDVYRCQNCGLQFVYPTPTAAALAHYYDQQYAVPLERYASNTARNEGRIVHLERWRHHRGRLLEIGASYGHSLALARQRGWQVAGVELSPTASAYAQQHFGLHVWNGDVLDAPFEPGSFDAIILWHVLEHTQDPRAQLNQILTLLKPGGVVGVRVPNIISLGARMAQRSWPWMCPPAHLWYFSPVTLTRLLRDCGFEVLEVATMRGDGNNPYQHAIISLGGRLNALRRRFGHHSSSPRTSATVSSPATSSPTSPHLIQRWHRLLARTQPYTDALARRTRWIIDPLETHGWGDELLCYARRPLDGA